jgi:hypothetical protein
MGKNRPQPGIEYASEPTAEFRAHKISEAAVHLAGFLGVTEVRAMDLLGGDPAVLVTEIRARRNDPIAARRLLEKRYERYVRDR